MTEHLTPEEQEFIAAQDDLEQSYIDAKRARYDRYQEDQHAWHEQRYAEKMATEQERQERRDNTPDRWYTWYRSEIQCVSFLGANPFPRIPYTQYMDIAWTDGNNRCIVTPKNGLQIEYVAYFEQEAFNGNGRIFRLTLPSNASKLLVIMEPKFSGPYYENPRPYEEVEADLEHKINLW